jgi:heme exporter protein D
MINEVLYMNGYGLYVWSSFVFTISCFCILYSVIKLQLVKEQKKFRARFESLETDKI